MAVIDQTVLFGFSYVNHLLDYCCITMSLVHFRLFCDRVTIAFDALSFSLFFVSLSLSLPPFLHLSLSVYTPLAFISCYVACGVCHLGDTCSEFDSPNTSPAASLRELDARIAEDCYCLASIALLEMSVKPFKASDTASAILYFVRQSLKVAPEWTAELSELTRTDPQRDGFKAVYKVLSGLFTATNKSNAAEVEVEEGVEEEVEVETAVSHSERERERERESTKGERSQGTCAVLTPTKSPSQGPSNSHSLSVDVHTNMMSTPHAIRGPLSVSDGNDGTEGISSALSSSTLSEGRVASQRLVPQVESDLPQGAYCTPTDDKENSCRMFLGPSPGSVAAMDSLEGV